MFNYTTVFKIDIGHADTHTGRLCQENITCLVVNLPPDIISLVIELCVLGILFQQEKLIFSLSIVLEQA